MRSSFTIEEDEGTQRLQWGNELEFLMSCIAMSVGLGNVWRFPFTAFENGGGAFLIPYIIVLILIGRPLYYLEMTLGQFTSRGNVDVFEVLAPALKGVGYGQLVGTTCVASYYCSLMAITLFYLISSFTSHLPWIDCKESWNEQNAAENVTCVSSTTTNITGIDNQISSSELYFIREVLKLKKNIDGGIGFPEWRLSLCLLISWLITFAVSWQGVKSSGKFSYFLAIFPYIVMFSLLMRAVTLKGSGTGIMYFIRPDWAKLAKAKVWYAAVTQCFFSLNVGFGTIIMYSSYNDFEHNINRDAHIITTIDTFTSLLAGTTIFGILGNLAYQLDVDITQVINSGGTGLAFISYPDAIAKFKAVPWLFAILFFCMLFVLGVGSLVAYQGCPNTVIMDKFPNLKSWHVSLGTAIVGFLIGLVYVTPGGQWILTLVDFYGGNFVIFSLVIIEMVAVSWCYGLENFCYDMEFMLKKKVGIYWRITWGCVTPVLLIIIFIYFISTITRLKYGSHDYPDLVLGIGWAILGVGVIQVPLWFWYYIYKSPEESHRESIKNAFSFENWHPQQPMRIAMWKEFKQTRLDERENIEKSWLSYQLEVLLNRNH